MPTLARTYLCSCLSDARAQAFVCATVSLAPVLGVRTSARNRADRRCFSESCLSESCLSEASTVISFFLWQTGSQCRPDRMVVMGLNRDKHCWSSISEPAINWKGCDGFSQGCERFGLLVGKKLWLHINQTWMGCDEDHCSGPSCGLWAHHSYHSTFLWSVQIFANLKPTMFRV